VALSGREKITVGAGVAIILLAGLIKLAALGMQSSGTATADTIAGAIARLEQHKTLKASVARLAEELSVEIPTVEATEQETQIRQSIAQLAQQNGLQISTLRRMESGGSLRRSATRPIQFQVSLVGSFDGLIQYVNALEKSGSPFVVRELSVNAARGAQGQPGDQPGPPQGGPRGGGPGQPPTGRVQANMRLQAHLFPEVLKSDKPKAEPTPPVMIVVEGNTVTFNGQTRTVSPEEIEKELQRLPPGATVVEE
jgi:NAD-dependent DNA ligase